MLKKIRYWRWKKKARKALAEKQTTSCALCDDPIVPGDFVAVGIVAGKEAIMHAGYQFSLSKIDSICETGALCCGYWNGKQVVWNEETLVAKAIRTGQIQIG